MSAAPLCRARYSHLFKNFPQFVVIHTVKDFGMEGMMLKLKLQYFGHLMRRVDSLEKTDAGRDWGQEEKGTTED